MEIQIINGNALDELKKLPDESVDCVVTSPPYYGLRSYKGAETIWGGNPACEHEFTNKWHKPRGGGDPVETTSVGNNLRQPHFEYDSISCIYCGAWKGQLGLEPTYQMYLEHLLMITKELKRVLKASGTLFWNMGDSYASEGGPSRHRGYSDPKWAKARNGSFDEPTSYPQGIKPKSLMMLPERFAIGMIDQGWILRNKIIWFKVNGLPSSVRDRFSNKWEYIFFFVKSKKYFFDLDAVRKPLKESSIKRIRQNVLEQFNTGKVHDFPDDNMNMKNILIHMKQKYEEDSKGANSNDVIDLDMQSKYLKDRTPNGSLAGRVMRNIADGKLETFVREAITNVNQYLKDKLKVSGLTIEQLAEMTGEKETTIAHYFRTDLSGVALPSKEFWDKAKDILELDEYDKHIKEEYKSIIPSFDKGANPGDVIDTPAVRHKSWYSNAGHKFTHDRKYDPNADGGDFFDIPTRPHKFAHFAVYPETLIEPLIKAGCPEGGTVLDPFAGSGTTGVVAQRLKRNAILIEISSEYINIINERIKLQGKVQ